MIEREFFGNEAQRALQRRGWALWTIVGDEPRFSYNGRVVGQHSIAMSDLPRVVAFAELQGATVSSFIPAKQEADMRAALADQGLDTDCWEQLLGAAETVTSSRAIVADKGLPVGFSYADLTPDTAAAVREDFAEVALSCGVLPPAPAALMGRTRRGYATMVLDAEGRVAATAGAVMENHPDSALGDAAWWGMLATRTDCRGLGFARLLGARAIVAMVERYGTKRFYSGVRTDNDASQRLCRGIGIASCDCVSLAAIDPSFGPLTK